MTHPARTAVRLLRSRGTWRLLRWLAQVKILTTRWLLKGQLVAVNTFEGLLARARRRDPAGHGDGGGESDLLTAQIRLQRFAARILLFKLLLAVGGTVAALTYTNPYTPPGHEGYVYHRPRLIGEGGFRGTLVGPANYGMSLWRHEVINLDIRPHTYSETFTVLTRDDLRIRFNFHAVIGIRRGNVVRVVEDYGGLQWYDRYVREPLRTYVRNALQKHPSTAIKSRMAPIARDVQAKMDAYLDGSPFYMVEMSPGDVAYPKLVAEAVESKLSAEQLLEEQKVRKAIAEKQAEIRQVEARSQAEAQKVIASTLSELFLRHAAIEAQRALAESPNKGTIYIPLGRDGLPMVKSVE